MRKLLAVPLLLSAAWIALVAATPMPAAEHRGGQYYSNSGRSYNGGNFRYNGGGREYVERHRDYRRGRDWDDYGRRRTSFSFGFYSAPRSYYYDPLPYYSYSPSYYVAPTYCNPNGFYDRWGYWHPDPNCAVDPYGY